MKQLIVMFLIAFCASAQASYINTCIVQGTITSEPQRGPGGLTTFDFEVQKSGAARDGRVDGSCKNYDKKITISLAGNDAKQTLHSGQILWLRDLYKDDRGSKSPHHFSLLSEAKGKSLLNPDR